MMPTISDIALTTEKYQQFLFFPEHQSSVKWRGSLPSEFEGSILADKNIVGLCTQYKYVQDKATDIPTITFIVKTKKSRSRLTREQRFKIPSELPAFDAKRGRFSTQSKIQTDIEESGGISLGAGRDPAFYVERKRPVSGGLSVGNARNVTAGTLGFWVELVDQGVIGVSNYHVLAQSDARVGDRIVQPGRLDHKGSKNTIGSLLEFFDFKDGANLVDIACLAPKDLADADLFRIEKIGEWNGFTTPVPGMRVAKVGRTTGYTEGEIQAVDATFFAPYGNERVRFTKQIKTNCKMKPGDSGAALVDLKSRKICGLCAALDNNGKISYANNIRYVLGRGSVSNWRVRKRAASPAQPLRQPKRASSR